MASSRVTAQSAVANSNLPPTRFSAFLENFNTWEHAGKIMAESKNCVAAAEKGMMGKVGRLFNEFPLSFTSKEQTYHAIDPKLINQWVSFTKAIVLSNPFLVVERNDRAAIIIDPDHKDQEQVRQKINTFIQDMIKQGIRDIFDNNNVQENIRQFLGINNLLDQNINYTSTLHEIKIQLLYSYCSQIISTNITEILSKDPDCDPMAVMAFNRFLSDLMINNMQDLIRGVFFKDEDKEMSRDKINEFTFKSQKKYPTSGGLVASTPISMTMASRLLRMSSDEFFQVFNPTKPLNQDEKQLVNDTLQSCVEGGIDLHKTISTNLNKNKGRFQSAFSFYKPIDTETMHLEVDKLDENQNVNGVLDLIPLNENRKPIVVGVHDQDRRFINLNDYFADISMSLQEFMKQDYIFFVATTSKNAISFFSRVNSKGEKFYYSIDSAAGKMQVYDNLKTMVESLTNTWKKGKDGYVEVMAYTLTSQILRNRDEVTVAQAVKSKEVGQEEKGQHYQH